MRSTRLSGSKAAGLKTLWDVVGESRPLLIATLAVAIVDMLADSIGLAWSIRLILNAALAADLQAVGRQPCSFQRLWLAGLRWRRWATTWLQGSYRTLPLT